MTEANSINAATTGIVGNTGTSFTATAATQHAVQVGGATTSTLTSISVGSTGQVFQANSAADPTWSTATYPSTATSTGTILRADGTNWVATTATYPATTTINQILYSSATSVISGLATANNGVLTTGTSGIPVITALGTDGQVIIGSSAGAPAAATLSAGTGISITNGHNTITIAATGAIGAWTDEGVSFNAVKFNGYFITAAATATMPGSPSQGDTISFIVDTTSSFIIQANTGQILRLGNVVSTSAGSLTNNARGDAITLVYRSSDTTWICNGSVQGSWTAA